MKNDKMSKSCHRVYRTYAKAIIATLGELFRRLRTPTANSKCSSLFYAHVLQLQPLRNLARQCRS